jgi:ribosomal protein L24E
MAQSSHSLLKSNNSNVFFVIESKYERVFFAKEEPTLSHCAWTRTFDLVVRWQM